MLEEKRVLAIISVEEYESILETLDILADPEAQEKSIKWIMRIVGCPMKLCL